GAEARRPAGAPPSPSVIGNRRKAAKDAKASPVGRVPWRTWRHGGSPWVVLVACAACVPASHELRAPVDADLRARLGTLDVSIDDALAHPLTADVAVRIAIANNPHVAAALDEVGIAASELAVTSLLG